MEYLFFSGKVDKLLAQGSEGDTGVGHLKETTSAIQTPTTTGDDVKKSVIPREVSRPGDTVILIITCNRVEYLKRTLEQVLEKKPTGSNQVSVVVSQDCNDPATSNYLEQQRGKVKIIKVCTYVLYMGVGRSLSLLCFCFCPLLSFIQSLLNVLMLYNVYTECCEKQSQ